MPENIEIGLTQFIDFTLKQGASRISFVRQVRDQTDYHPGKDFWKELRDAIKQFHENGYSPDFLDSIVSKVHDRKKMHYAEAIKQYKKFCRNKQIEWFEPGRSHWVSNGLYVRSSPEVGLIVNGSPYLVKLYFKEHSEKLDKRKTSTILTLLSESTFSNPRDSAVQAVLNVKKAQLFPRPDAITRDMKLSLEAEAQQFAYIWNNL
ncbi:hypothetical protein P9302_09130 [Brevibacillus agri]|uniref:hypothetical protein n=1 Tax=Brevibacillus agri TaxID=51101 RepID=UPI002E1A4325|nr:hypothetical protein [Brevibacillus agri]